VDKVEFTEGNTTSAIVTFVTRKDAEMVRLLYIMHLTTSP